MGEPVAVTTLIRLRSKLSGELAHNEERQAQLRADLTHVDAVLRMLGTLEPDQIPPRRFATQWFKRGDTKRAVLEILREADGPLTAMQIGARVLEKQGLDPNDRRAQGRIRQSVQNVLRKCRDVAHDVGVNKEKHWRLAA
ncbi:hypothetical protein [Azospirillum sp. sgz301742]